ncbi:Fructoselysine-6-P-deglycase FrlB with duplicated sugar isomerase (SIS) domain [Micromonospora citrea]|uniref:Fructoselysine-6-P-deglycase FrlB with duplicated sugar isomerase (SIS) domain n=1 Tax=Micromonospora citrea TaxID=47855 RepID=A0A1C6VYA4_9ACTN|nr:SIS domain-containing protein [Micromonospora citrea]SCL71104.1 Fructoselysine-6-P-deglycase FrlB with duplicated sugar isomerase (SIS) domain [Micromonospora citrea]
MSYVASEIASQPETWRHAAALVAQPEVARALPRPGERVAVVGCGTSYFMAQSFAALRESAGQGETDAFAASEFPTGRRYDRVVAITRSGTTTEVVRLLEGLPAGTRSTVVTTDAALPAARLATDRVVLGLADERSVVQTRFATTALAAWRVGLGRDLTDAIAQARARLAEPLDPAVVGREQFTFLGTGWTVGLAHEAALKLREAAQVWAESYPAMEFRHGPISVIDHRSVVWIFGPPVPGLRDDLAGTGAIVVHEHGDPMASLTTAQRLAVELATRRGLDPDRPRLLTRSVVLPVPAA